ncbi:MAG: hypothetical protein LBB23_00695 [Rickettsiales bacterium]|jgi:hypothetical protein|nr:hypothetical protein [Rickettsiales bacterium]
MRKSILIFAALFTTATARADYDNYLSGYTRPMQVQATAADFVSPESYNYMQPYLNAGMMRQLSPDRTMMQNQTTQFKRKVMPRSYNSAARSAAAPDVAAASATLQARGAGFDLPQTVQTTRGSVGAARNSTPQDRQMRNGIPGSDMEGLTLTPQWADPKLARAADINAGIQAGGLTSTGRRITARGGHNTGAARSATVQTGGRLTPNAGSVPLAQTTGASEVSLSQCMADYKKCMDGYCSRPASKYDRCYCSAKLAQLDAKFQPQIEMAQKKLAVLSVSGKVDDWSATDAGNVFDWAGTEATIKGQEAYLAGNNVCSKRMYGCYYAASQLTNLYRSEMSKSCKAYENYLTAFLNSLEAQVANYY